MQLIAIIVQVICTLTVYFIGTTTDDILDTTFILIAQNNASRRNCNNNLFLGKLELDNTPYVSYSWSSLVVTQPSTSYQFVCVCVCVCVCLFVLHCLAFIVAVHLDNKSIFTSYHR